MGLFSFLGIVAGDTVLENNDNQIVFDNFIVQGQKQSILTYKKGCMKDMLGNPIDNVSNNILSDTYLSLYDSLVDSDIITKKVTSSSLFTWSNTYIISKTISLDAKNIEEILEKKNNKDYQKVKECFVIDFTKLSTFLKNYKYNPTDQVEVLNPGKTGGKQNKTKKNKTKKKKTNRKNKKEKITRN
jgi:hypothetical protein